MIASLTAVDISIATITLSSTRISPENPFKLFQLFNDIQSSLDKRFHHLQNKVNAMYKTFHARKTSLQEYRQYLREVFRLLKGQQEVQLRSEAKSAIINVLVRLEDEERDP